MKNWLLVVLLAFCASAVSAQEFPTRPIRFLVSYPPGGGVDFMARLVASDLEKRLGQPIAVENRPGGGGALGVSLVAKAPADGYTVLVTGDAPITQLPLLSKTSYDPYKDLTALVKGVTVPTSVIVAANAPYKTFAELIQFARANPGKLSYGTPGNGSAMHAELEMLKDRLKVDIVHVPYKGAPPIIADAIGGQISIGAPGLPPTIGSIKAGQLRLLAVWGNSRVGVFPDVPTVREASGDDSLGGMPTWYGFLLPTGVPPAIAKRLETAIVAALRSDTVARRLADAGATVSAETSETFDRSNRAQTAAFAQIFQRLGLKAE
ncbi:MAG: Bug family tripartite tricarboxylate transporter substrate binding protein [Burkholderiaceae bacterium]